MNASKKLRILAVEAKENHGWDSGPYDIASASVAYALLDALPLIADLVEATELQADIFYDYTSLKLHEAIAALQEHLNKNA